MRKGSLTVVGCGIKFMSHLTIEAKTMIEQADKVLYLVNEPAMQEWLKTTIAHSLNLESAYSTHMLRKDTYAAITQTILQHLNDEKHVCVLLEGHPIVFAKPARDAVIAARNRGYETRVYPGISAEDYLLADLLIDPGTCGSQSYEATDFLIHGRLFDGMSHLILWQIGMIGMLDNREEFHVAHNLQVLVNHLSRIYHLDHQVIIYEGSQYPHIASRMEQIALKDLPHSRTSQMSTLYVPPLHKASCDLTMLQQLNIEPSQLRATHEYHDLKTLG